VRHWSDGNIIQQMALDAPQEVQSIALLEVAMSVRRAVSANRTAAPKFE
jgi:hypothetical protein